MEATTKVIKLAIKFTVDPVKMAAALKAVREFTSPDPTRSALGNVYAEAVRIGSSAVPDGVRFTATDGHTMCCVEIEGQVDIAGEPARLTPIAVDTLLLRCKAAKSEASPVVDFLLEDCSSEIRFPEYRAVLPLKLEQSDNNGPRKISFNPQYLARIAVVQKALKPPKGTPGVVMQFGESEQDPLRADIRGDLGSAVIVIMPCRF